MSVCQGCAGALALPLTKFFGCVKRLPAGALFGRRAPKPNIMNQMGGFVRIKHFDGESIKMAPHSLLAHYRAR